MPLFLDIPGTGGVMMLDEDGVPQQNGTATYPFTIMVPYSAQNQFFRTEEVEVFCDGVCDPG